MSMNQMLPISVTGPLGFAFHKTLFDIRIHRFFGYRHQEP